MRLTQLEGKEDVKSPPKSIKSTNPGKEELEVLKEITKEMHTTMLQADLVMRRLAQILDKY